MDEWQHLPVRGVSRHRGGRGSSGARRLTVHPFSYLAVDTERAAIAGGAAGGRYVAGGTTLIDLMREEVEQPQRLIDINPLPLRAIRLQDDALIIGALARMSDVAAHPAVRKSHPLIAEALIEGASPQIRNMASIGGNLLQRARCPYFRTLDAACNKRTPGSGCAAIGGINSGHALFGTSAHCVATHPSDLAVALVALDATVTVRGQAGERRVPVEELYWLPGETPHLEHTLERGELIVEVRVPHARYARYARYIKVRDRASYEFAVVSVAAALEVSEGIILAARLAAGGVGTRPWRFRAAEDSLVGQSSGQAAWDAAARLAITGARPLPGNHFKVELLRRVTIRALALAADGPAAGA
jgi:xanthine dehydrogenase YagS FAD-binding subunit